MIQEFFIIAAAIVLTVILLLKVNNMVNKFKAYDIANGLMLFAVAAIFFMFAFISFLQSGGNEPITTIVDGADTITVTHDPNQLLVFLPFIDIFNGEMFLIFLLTIVEVIMVSSTSVIERKASPRFMD